MPGNNCGRSRISQNKEKNSPEKNDNYNKMARQKNENNEK
jgi:hypothetical protein